MDSIQRAKMHSRNLLFILLGSLSLTQIIFWISLQVSNGLAMNSIVYDYFSSSFSHYFNNMAASISSNPYSSTEIGLCPPLEMLFLKFISGFTKTDVLEYKSTMYPHFSEAMLPMIMLYMLLFTVLGILVYNTKKGSPIIKMWFTLIVLASAPFITLIESGSMTVVSLVFILLFINHYHDNRKWCRRLSYLSLAVAAGFNIFSIVFILLIIKEKKWVESLEAIVLCVLLFYIPCFFYKGIDTSLLFIEKIIHISDAYGQAGISSRIDFFSGCDAISYATGHGAFSLDILRYILWGVLLVILVAGTFITKSKWRSVFAVTLIMVALPNRSYISNSIMLIVPLIMMIDSDEERLATDYIYTLLFTVLFAPLAFDGCVLTLPKMQGSSEIYLYFFLAPIIILLMAVLLGIECAGTPLARIELDPKKKARIAAEMEKNNSHN